MAKKNSSTVTVSFVNPIDALLETAVSIKETATTLLDEVFTSARQDRIKKSFIPKVSVPKFNFNKKTGLQLAVPVLVVIILAFVVFAFIKKAAQPQVAGVATSRSTEIKTVNINRDFKFPLTDEKGKKVGEFTYTLTSADLRHQVVLKGANATSVEGRVFLIINLKLDNKMNQGLQINTRDYIRISVNGEESQLAPDIHNDPVEAQAISATNTRVGIAINESDRDIKLQVGEIQGKKTTIPLEFK